MVVMHRPLFWMAVLLLFSGTPLLAQTPAGEISAGWAFLHSLDASNEGLDEFANFPLGFHVGGAGRITDFLGIAGDLGWNRKSQNLFGVDTKLTFTTFSGGPRFYFGDRVTGFVHALFGGIRGDANASFEDQEDSESQTEFMIQPGAGVDFRAGDAVAFRAQFDYQWINAEDTDGNLRFVVAAVFYLGER
jgi:opacity protein-like surface antigen